MTKKIEAALTTVKAVRSELLVATRGYTRAAKNVASLEAKLVAAQVELDTAAAKAEEALKKALATTKALTVSSVKKVPAVKPAPRVSPKNEAKPLPVKAGAVAPKPTRAQQREAARLAKAKAPVGGKVVAVKPAVKKPAAKPAVKAPAAKPVRAPKKPGTVGKFDVKAK